MTSSADHEPTTTRSVARAVELLRRWLPLPRPLPSVSLIEHATPAHRLDKASAESGRELWVKRDDLSAPAYGGNKVRKLELLLGEARAHAARAVVTVGGIGSNHVLATAIYARQLGMAPYAFVFPQPITEGVRHTASLLADLGTDVTPMMARPLIPLVPLWAGALWRLRGRAHPYFIPPGGSSPLGTLGYVAAALELAEQVRQGVLPEPDEIWVALGSAGTAVGLQIGLAIAGLSTRVVAVRVVEAWLLSPPVIALLRRRTLGLIDALCEGRAPAPALAPMEIVGDQKGPRYGAVTPAGLHAVARAAEDDLALETTYTGKTFAALLARCAVDGAGRRPCRLFWNTYNSRQIDTHDIWQSRRPLPRTVSRWLAA